MKKYITGLLLLAFAPPSWAEPTRLVCAGSYVSSSTSQELNVHTGQFDSVGRSETINLRYEVLFDEANQSFKMSGFSCLKKKDLVDGWARLSRQILVLNSLPLILKPRELVVLELVFAQR